MSAIINRSNLTFMDLPDKLLEKIVDKWPVDDIFKLRAINKRLLLVFSKVFSKKVNEEIAADLRFFTHLQISKSFPLERKIEDFEKIDNQHTLNDWKVIESSYKKIRSEIVRNLIVTIPNYLKCWENVQYSLQDVLNGAQPADPNFYKALEEVCRKHPDPGFLNLAVAHKDARNSQTFLANDSDLKNIRKKITRLIEDGDIDAASTYFEVVSKFSVSFAEKSNYFQSILDSWLKNKKTIGKNVFIASELLEKILPYFQSEHESETEAYQRFTLKDVCNYFQDDQKSLSWLQKKFEHIKTQ